MYEIILYDTEDGRCPVQELLDSLEPKLLAKTLRTIDLLEMNGPLLREPYSNPLVSTAFLPIIKKYSTLVISDPWSLSCWQKHCGQLIYWK